MPWLLLIAAALLCFIALWTVIPAPVLWLVAASIGGSELSPIFLILSLVMAIAVWRAGGSPRNVSIVLLQVAIVLFAIPIGRYPSSEAPLSLRRVLTGIDTGTARISRHIQIDGTATPLTLDVYQPNSPGPHPIIVQIYGGAWRSGEPGNDATFATHMASRGYVVFAVDYRHAPSSIWPAQIDDVRAAIAWIRRHAADYDADPMRIALMGRSAGAQLAMVAGFTDPGIRAVIDYYGPVNLERGWREPPRPDPIGSRSVLEAFLGGTPDRVPERYKAASPIEFVSSQIPATLLIYGSRDHIVQAKYGRDLRDRIRAVGGSVEFVEIPWADHAFDLIPGGLSGQLSLWHAERFLNAVLGH